MNYSISIYLEEHSSKIASNILGCFSRDREAGNYILWIYNEFSTLSSRIYFCRPPYKTNHLFLMIVHLPIYSSILHLLSVNFLTSPTLTKHDNSELDIFWFDLKIGQKINQKMGLLSKVVYYWKAKFSIFQALNMVVM